MQNMMIGVDLAKNVFQVHVASRAGEVQCRKKLSRKQFSAFMAQQEPSLVIFEACGSAHYWAREMEALDHEVRLIAPQYVRPFDEAHAMQNAVGSEQGRGVKPSQQGLAGLRLQLAAPRARVFYISATGATSVHNLAYAARLGLWGQGPEYPFPSPESFVSAMEAGGVAAMEVVARDLKTLGLYTARALSFDGAEYDVLEHALTPAQIEIYDAYAGAFRTIHHNLEAALTATGVNGASGETNASAAGASANCRYAVTRETFPLTSQTWEEGDVHEQGSTRDST